MAARSKTTISAAIICRDEESDLPACLASVSWCDEIVVVVDSRTVDRSAVIASAAGARVFLRDWQGHTPQKNFAFSQCQSTWILSIDADERVPRDLQDEILETLPSGDGTLNGYFMPRKNYWIGQWIRHGGWYPDLNLRLFRRGFGECRYIVHERIEVSGATAVLHSAMVHDNIKSIDDHLQTMIFRATPGEVVEMLANPVRFYVLPLGPFVTYLREFLSGPKSKLRAYLLAKRHFKNRVAIIWLVPFLPLAKFLNMYVVKAGFRDGWRGFWIATLSAMYIVLKYAMYWEATRVTRDRTRADERLAR